MQKEEIEKMIRDAIAAERQRTADALRDALNMKLGFVMPSFTGQPDPKEPARQVVREVLEAVEQVLRRPF